MRTSIVIYAVALAAFLALGLYRLRRARRARRELLRVLRGGLL